MKCWVCRVVDVLVWRPFNTVRSLDGIKYRMLGIFYNVIDNSLKRTLFRQSIQILLHAQRSNVANEKSNF